MASIVKAILTPILNYAVSKIISKDAKIRKAPIIMTVISMVVGIGATLLVSSVTQTDKESPYLASTIIGFVDASGEEHLLNVEIADTDESRQRGLMFRESMDFNRGMLFIFPDEQPRTFWMQNTLISLDIIFMDSDLTVLTIHENTKTNQTSERYSSFFPSQYVLETNAGWSRLTGLEVGEIFAFE